MLPIHIDGLTHVYSGSAIETRTILAIDSWAVAEGEHVLLRGVSGSGKTTLLNILAGLLKPTAGSVHIGKQSLYELSEAHRDRFRARAIGYVFQVHHLLATLTVLENVVMPMAFARRLPRSQWRQRAVGLLEQVGLGDFLQHRPVQLSTGQRMRVAIARALVNKPAILLADEPTAALDSTSAAAVMALMHTTCAQARATLIVASHNPSIAAQFDRCVDIREGRLLVDQEAVPSP